MTRNEIGRKYDEFFGVGLWERDYKQHIVIFTEQCIIKQEQNVITTINVNPSLLRNRRLKLHLSMQDVTDKTGISKATISRIEHGNDAFFKTIMILHEFYNINRG